MHAIKAQRILAPVLVHTRKRNYNEGVAQRLMGGGPIILGSSNPGKVPTEAKKFSEHLNVNAIGAPYDVQYSLGILGQLRTETSSVLLLY